MSVTQEEHWITGEEFGAERRRLIAAGVPDEDPRFQALYDRVASRSGFIQYRLPPRESP